MRTTVQVGCAVFALMVAGCAGDDLGAGGDGGYGSVTSGLSKCLGGTNGDNDFCSPGCPCDEGEGDCDGDDTCSPGLECAVNAGPQFGLGRVDVCVSAACDNNVWDVDECGTDCGGTSACGSCTVTLLTKNCGGTNGGGAYCGNPNFPCLAGEGDCDTDAQCALGLVCAFQSGASFGLPPTTDVCVDPADLSCTNNVWDTDECGVDCGGTSGCGMCTNQLLTKTCGGTNGGNDFCRNPNEPCQAGEGDCDGNGQCAAGLVCGTDKGLQFGLGLVDACVSATCVNRVWDVDECGRDCGGTSPCGDCSVVLLTKNCGASLGDGSYCRNPNFPCGVGEGDCDSNAECMMGLVCGSSNGEQFGLPRTVDVCVDPACDNGIEDPNEDGVDCGGTSNCGPCQPTGVANWGAGFGDDDQDFGRNIATDSSDNVYAVGFFRETIDFGGGTLTATAGRDVFLAKFDSDGNHLWSQSFGGTGGTDIGLGVAVDSADNVIVTGYFQSTINFGGADLTAAGGGSDTDIFVAKFNSAGVHQWSFSYGDTENQQGWGVATDSADNVILTGYYEGAPDFGGGALASQVNWSIYLVKLSSAGAHVFSDGYGSSGSEQFARHVAVDGADNIVIAGPFAGSVNFGGGNLTSAGERDGYVAKFNSAGAHQWSIRFGDAARNEARRVEVDSNGDVIVAGYFRGSVDLGCGSLAASGGAEHDVLLAKLNGATGSCRWSSRYGDTAPDLADGLSIDDNDRILVGGSFEGTLDFGDQSITSQGGRDAWVAKFFTDGRFAWVRRFGNSVDQFTGNLATDSAGNVTLTGWFSGTVTLSSGGVISSAGVEDVFLAQYGP